MFVSPQTEDWATYTSAPWTREWAIYAAATPWTRAGHVRLLLLGPGQAAPGAGAPQTGASYSRVCSSHGFSDLAGCKLSHLLSLLH